MRGFGVALPAEHRRGWMRVVLIGAGSLCVAAGVAGMFLPLLPSFEFLLLAGVLYGKSSPAASRWLMTNRLFGRRLSDYREGHGATLATKLWTGVLLWVSIGATVVLFSPPLWITLPLVAVGIGVSLHLAWLKTI